MRNNGPVYMSPMRINLANGHYQREYGTRSETARYLKLSDVPVLDFCVWWIARQRNVDTLDMMEQDFGIIPLVWFELPSLPSSHDAYDPIPGVRSELRKSLSTVHHEISNCANVLETANS